MRSLFLAVFGLISFFSFKASAQTVTGEWYGVGKVKKAGDYNSYLSEMVLRQKGNKVYGEYNYFYRSAEIKTKLSGTYDPRFKLLELKARPILNFLARNENGADCPMEGSFTLKVVNGKKTLAGQFNPTYEYRITCPAIDVTFTKAGPKKEQTKKTVIENDEDEEPPVQPEPMKNPVAPAQRDSVSKPMTAEQQALANLTKRTFEVSPVIEVESDTLKVSIYDNGEVDNDTISVFINRQLIKHRQMLSNQPFSFIVPLDSTVKEISMLAENLGKIPPNTALAIIYAGHQRFELNLTSTLEKNAAIRFKRKTKRSDPKNIN